MQRKVNVLEDLDGNKIVFIHDVKFKGKRSVEWIDVEQYLNEYIHSNYTMLLKGANAKAKANAAQGLPELIGIATQKAHKDKIDRYNVFQVVMIVRHAEDEKMYLYDIMNIKKETSNLF